LSHYIYPFSKEDEINSLKASLESSGSELQGQLQKSRKISDLVAKVACLVTGSGRCLTYFH
jgi:hypothetical protein